MTGWCPYKNGSLSEIECHFDGLCVDCPQFEKRLKEIIKQKGDVHESQSTKNESEAH